MGTKCHLVFNVLVFIVAFFSTSLFAAGKISGLVFGDYYWVAKNHDTTTQLSNDKGFERQNGFWIRRIYFTYDHDFDDKFSARLRLEANSKDFKTTTAEDLKPYIKDAYLRYKANDHSLFLGLSPTPLFDLVENHWGLRPVEKSPEDLWGFGSSRDLGLAAKGSFRKGVFGYHAMFGNGAGNKHEVNKGKKGYLSLTFAPIEELIFEAYSDYESNSRNVASHLFGGYKTRKWWGGVLFSRLKKAKSSGGFDKFNLVTLYGAVKPMDKVTIFGRVDGLSRAGLGDADYLRSSKNAKPTLFIAGLDYELCIKNAHLIPNVEVVTYDKSSVKTDVIPRLTFFWTYP